MGTDGQTNKQTNGQIFAQYLYSGISSHSLRGVRIQNMVNANCGEDIDVIIAQLTILLMVNPSHFPDQCCYLCAKLLHHYNPQKYSLTIGSLGFRQADGTINSEYG
jgi:hypothetical protein